MFFFFQAARRDCCVSEITVEELKLQIKSMVNGKSADCRGIVAEILKESPDCILDTITNLNDILKVTAELPTTWKLIRLNVLFQKGNALELENYRPISILPILYKVFSRMLCTRIKISAEIAAISRYGGA